MRRDSIQLGAALAVLVILVVGYAFFYQTVQDYNAERLALETQVSDRAPSSGMRLANDLSAQEATVDSYLVAEGKAPAFINDIEARARAQGASITITSVSMNGSGLTAALQVNFSLKGNFDTVTRTVGALEYSPYDLTITSLAFVHNLKDQWQADLKVSVAAPPPLLTP